MMDYAALQERIKSFSLQTQLGQESLEEAEARADKMMEEFLAEEDPVSKLTSGKTKSAEQPASQSSEGDGMMDAMSMIGSFFSS